MKRKRTTYLLIIAILMVGVLPIGNSEVQAKSYTPVITNTIRGSFTVRDRDREREVILREAPGYQYICGVGRMHTDFYREASVVDALINGTWVTILTDMKDEDYYDGESDETYTYVTLNSEYNIKKLRIRTRDNDRGGYATGKYIIHYGNFAPSVEDTKELKTSVTDAKNNAYNAKLSADSAKTEAINAKNSANTAASRVWDTTESKSAATLAKEARDKSNSALSEINNLKSTVKNIQASVSNLGSEIQKVSGLNGATCTQSTTFNVVVQASGVSEFRASSDGVSWSSWTPINSYTTVTNLRSGANTIYVEARNGSGATAVGQITVFKI